MSKTFIAYVQYEDGDTIRQKTVTIHTANINRAEKTIRELHPEYTIITIWEE